MQHSFIKPTIRKPTTSAFQNTLAFGQYIFNSMSNLNVEFTAPEKGYHINSLVIH